LRSCRLRGKTRVESQVLCAWCFVESQVVSWQSSVVSERQVAGCEVAGCEAKRGLSRKFFVLGALLKRKVVSWQSSVVSERQVAGCGVAGLRSYQLATLQRATAGGAGLQRATSDLAGCIKVLCALLTKNQEPGTSFTNCLVHRVWRRDGRNRRSSRGGRFRR
jgi:hypothetical protein